MFLLDPEFDPGWQLKVILIIETYDLLTDSKSQIREGLWNQCINHTVTDILCFHLESHTFSFLWNILTLIKAFSLFIFLPQSMICSDLPWHDVVSKKQKEEYLLLGNVSRIICLGGIRRTQRQVLAGEREQPPLLSLMSMQPASATLSYLCWWHEVKHFLQWWAESRGMNSVRNSSVTLAGELSFSVSQNNVAMEMNELHSSLLNSLKN